MYEKYMVIMYTRKNSKIKGENIKTPSLEKMMVLDLNSIYNKMMVLDLNIIYNKINI
jgi:hypothetical protein